ncbi:MAG: MFS transporter [Halioglobus sp.]
MQNAVFTLRPFLALFTSCFILFLGNGLVNVLLPVRMEMDGIATDMIGMVLSFYYVGMLIGAFYARHLITRAGHIRMFAGCVAISAVSILLCSLYAESSFWGLMRILIGFCNACAFTAMESWLSGSSTKENRGKILGIYNAVALAGLFGGQFFMNVAAPSDTTLFVIAGILLCLAVVPVLVSAVPGPKTEEQSPLSLISLYRISPLGVVSCIAAGVTYSAVFNLLPLFASDYGITGLQLSIYMGTVITGAFVLQFPVGYLSDRFDRRTVLLVLLAVAAICALLVTWLASASMFILMYITTAVCCGIIGCIYPLSISETFDRLKQGEMLAAMSSLILVFSFGGVIGPYTASVVMDLIGNAALFYFLVGIMLLLAMFVVYRMNVREALALEDQELFVMQTASVTASSELDPRPEYIDLPEPMSSEAETAVTLAEIDPGAAVNMARAMALSNPALAAEIAAAVASVPGINVLRLYEVMQETVPDMLQEVTHAIVASRSDLAYELVIKMAEWYPHNVVSVAAVIGKAYPELRVEMARVAVATAPESALEVAEYYAEVLAEEHGAVRPADREDDSSEEDIVSIASELLQGTGESGQALEIAVVMADAMPEAAVPLAQEYIASNVVGEHPMATEAETNAEEVCNSVDLVARFAHTAPDQAMDVAVAVVEAVHESAASVATEMAESFSDFDELSADSDVNGDASDIPEAVELVQRLSDAAPENAMDVAVAVVEVVPESAAEVAADYASHIHESESLQGREKAVELVQRISNVSPEHIIDIAVAVIEEIPQSASDIVNSISDGDEASDGEWADSLDK